MAESFLIGALMGCLTLVVISITAAIVAGTVMIIREIWNAS